MIKALAVRELEKIELSDISRIVLYQKYLIGHEVLIPRYVNLCMRDEPLTVHEASELGLETTMKIARARENARGGLLGKGDRSPIPAGLERHDIDKLVKSLFGLSTDN
jgi:hypothetical protein